jgi:hypothetical protein
MGPTLLSRCEASGLKNSDPTELTPKQIAAIKRQLQVANARLIAIEREQRELRANMKTLVALLKRTEGLTEK